MTVIYKAVLKIILIGSLLVLLPPNNCQETKQEARFKKAIEYWTETLCTLQKTKTFVFHGIFANSSQALRDFFNALIHATSEYCGAVVLLKMYTLPDFRRNGISNVQNSNSSMKIADNNQHAWMDEDKDVKRQAIWRLASAVNIHHHKWNIKRYWRRNDEYYIDIWTVNVIFLGDIDSFLRLLDSGTPFQWNSREHFFVLAVWNDALVKLIDKRPLIDKTMRKLWTDHRILNVYFAEPLSSSENFNFYSYDPFATDDERAWGHLEYMDGSSKRRILRSLSTLIHRRVMNFNGYQFNVSIFSQGLEGIKIKNRADPNSIYSGGFCGFSGILLSAIARKLNFRVNVVEPNTSEIYGHQMENGTLSGAMGDVVYRKVVGSFASFFVKRYFNDMSGVEFTATTGFDQVCVMVPKAAKIPKGLRMFYIFDASVWLCMLASFILLHVVWHYMQVLWTPRSENVHSRKKRLNLLYLCVGYPVSLPKRISERYLFLGIFFCGITLVGIFNGMLYKSFATNMFYKDISSLAELDASQLPIGFYSYSTTDLFGSKDEPSLSPVLKNLQKKMIHISRALEMTALHRNVSGLLRQQYSSLTYESLIDETGTHMLHRVKECPAKFYLACLLPSNSFLREKVNSMIESLNQAGLPTLWRTQTLLENAVEMKVDILNNQKFQKKIFVAFQLGDFQISFLILGLGLFLSTIVFFVEKGWIKLCLKKK